MTSYPRAHYLLARSKPIVYGNWRAKRLQAYKIGSGHTLHAPNTTELRLKVHNVQLRAGGLSGKTSCIILSPCVSFCLSASATRNVRENNFLCSTARLSSAMTKRV